MSKIRVGVLFGGRSSEHAISCISANSIINAISREKYEVIPIGLTKDNEWVIFADQKPFLTLQKSDLPEVINQGIQQHKPLSVSKFLPADLMSLDVIFPVLHGPYGEDGTIQGLIDLHAIAFVGAGVLSSSISMDKTTTKAILKAGDFSVGEFVNILDSQWVNKKQEVLAKVKELGLPVFVKPARAGSSVGIKKINVESEIEAAIESARKFDKRVIVEKSIENAREIECGVISGEDRKAARASLPAEIIVKKDHEFYDFEAKYLDDSVDLVVPAKLDKEVVKEIQLMATRVFDLLNCEGLARVDFFVTKDNKVIINEINTMPGFTSISMFPRMWEASGIRYSELVDYLIEEAINRSIGLH
jgi:D-alanine-D-alanine ligase